MFEYYYASRPRKHHLLKIFGGWRDKQLPDGTVIWFLRDGHTYVTMPGSAAVSQSLCADDDVRTGYVELRSTAMCR